MGQQPVFIARNRDGELNAFINACSHRGAMLCRFKRGNRAIYTCPFHGWTFTNSGKLLKVKNPDGAGYPDCFNNDGSHDLTKIARFEAYRGFLFGSLNPDVPPLAAHLGEATKIIDLMVDQSPQGLEVLRGSSTYVYDGNWKLQTENGADGYHVTTVHWNYVATT
jgi:benzoate/toluate 1,2-dioxygenase alpha subunit